MLKRIQSAVTDDTHRPESSSRLPPLSLSGGNGLADQERACGGDGCLGVTDAHRPLKPRDSRRDGWARLATMSTAAGGQPRPRRDVHGDGYTSAR